MQSSQVVLITGASSGIGRATAIAFATRGYIVYATARRLDSLADLQARGCYSLQLDVTDEASMLAAVQQIEAAHGAVDVLVNNAGYGVPGAVEEVRLDQWRKQFEINVFGLVRLTQLVLPGMRAKGRGRILNISSGGGEMTFPLAGSYHATKYAVESLSDALRFEVAPFGIDVIVIQPGAVKTPLAEATVAGLNAAPDSPYYAMVSTYGQQMSDAYQRGQGVLTPEAVASVVLEAAQSKRPRTRYKIGATARLMPMLRHILSDRMWDRMLKRMLSSSRSSNAGNSTQERGLS